MCLSQVFCHQWCHDLLLQSCNKTRGEIKAPLLLSHISVFYVYKICVELNLTYICNMKLIWETLNVVITIKNQFNEIELKKVLSRNIRFQH